MYTEERERQEDEQLL